MTGMTETNFGIMEPFARAQFPLVLYRLCGSPAVGYVRQFPDVGEGIWYTYTRGELSGTVQKTVSYGICSASDF